MLTSTTGEAGSCTPSVAAPSLMRVAAALSYNLILGLVSVAVPSIVLPRELSLLTSDAATFNSAFTALGAVCGMLTPIVGHSIDRYGTNTPHKIASAACMTVGALLAVVQQPVSIHGPLGRACAVLLEPVNPHPRIDTRQRSLLCTRET